jgi:hypothetical protein
MLHIELNASLRKHDDSQNQIFKRLSNLIIIIIKLNLSQIKNDQGI